MEAELAEADVWRRALLNRRMSDDFRSTVVGATLASTVRGSGLPP